MDEEHGVREWVQASLEGLDRARRGVQPPVLDQAQGRTADARIAGEGGLGEVKAFPPVLES